MFLIILERAFGITAFLIYFSDKPHPHSVGAHNDDFVIADTKLYKPLPRTDRRCAGKAIILVVTTVGNVDFPHQHSSPRQPSPKLGLACISRFRP